MKTEIYPEVNLKRNTQKQDLAFLNVTQVRENFVFNVFEDMYVVFTVLKTREPDDVCAIINGGTDYSQILLWDKVSSIAYNIALKGQMRRGSKGLTS
jgi:hypothetical protein